MYGGRISENTNTGSNGGGVLVAGTFNMYGGTISGNVTEMGSSGGAGGGVYVAQNAKFNMTGGTISGNTTSNGGGVYVKPGATFNMSGGTISDNVGGYTVDDVTYTGRGGGVYVDSTATFTMTDGTISGNTAGELGNPGYGGGVYSAGTFNLKGGSIVNNRTIGSSRSVGGGVNSFGTFNVSGNPIVKGNTGTDGSDTSPDNVDLSGNNATINVAEKLGTDAEIIINSNNKTITPAEKKNVWYTWDATTETLKAPTGSSGGETGGETTEHKHCVCGTGTLGHTHDANVTWTAINTNAELKGLENVADGGHYYLAADIDMGSDWWVAPNNAVLCLNGKTLTIYNGIVVSEGQTFALTDCKPDRHEGSVSWSQSESGYAGVDLMKNAQFIMYAGKIEKFNIGVELDEDGTTTSFTMYDGTISDCTSSGVSVKSGSNAAILGGEITGNYTGMTVYGGALTIGGNANITGNMGEGNRARNVNFECQEITPITVRNDFAGSFGVTVWDSVAAGTQIINGSGYNGTITCDSWNKVIDTSGKLQSAPVENTYTVTFVVDSTTPWGTVAPSVVQNVPYGAEIKWNQANSSITVGEQSVTVTPQAEDADYTYSVKAMGLESNVVTQNMTVTVIFGRTAKTGGETGGDTPTPTPEAPRYYYSSGSGSSGAGGLSAVQNDPNGKSATDYSGGIYGLLFRTNAALSAFRGVQVDGVTIDAANYSVEGNEVYLKAVYLQTLANGKHTLTVLSGEGDATAEFTVGSVVSAPKTADAGALAYLGLALSSYMGTALVTRRKKEF